MSPEILEKTDTKYTLATGHKGRWVHAAGEYAVFSTRWLPHGRTESEREYFEAVLQDSSALSEEVGDGVVVVDYESESALEMYAVERTGERTLWVLTEGLREKLIERFPYSEPVRSGEGLRREMAAMLDSEPEWEDLFSRAQHIGEESTAAGRSTVSSNAEEPHADYVYRE